MVYVTHKNIEDAKKMCRALINCKLIACANLYPIESLYEWEGKVIDEKEIVSILKTNLKNWDSLKSKIEEIHPYEIPCIAKIDSEFNHKFSKWLDSELDKADLP